MSLSKMVTNITMEMSGDIKKYMVSAVQGDRATRCVLVKLVNNGEPYMIPDGARAIVNIKKPDGKFVYNKCTYSGNEVTIDLTSQALAASGTAYCNVEIRTADDTQIITSATFEIEIETTQRSDSAIESSNEFTAIEVKVNDLIEKISDTNSAAAKIAKEVEQKLKNGELKGEKGDKGDTGEKGATGESGVTMPANGMIALSGDENGNLWCYYSDADNPPQFETDDTGNIYYILPD